MSCLGNHTSGNFTASSCGAFLFNLLASLLTLIGHMYVGCLKYADDTYMQIHID